MKKLNLEITVCPSQVPLDIMRTKLCKGLIKFSSSVQRQIEADCGNETKQLQHLLPKGIRYIIRTTCYFHLGVKEEEENVHVDDFIVVVQTEFQRHLMQKFANKGICCDSTHGTTGKRTIRIYYLIKAFINIDYFLN